MKSPRTRSQFLMIATGLALVGALPGLRGADWPTYRHDFARSGVTPEPLPNPLPLQWTYVAAHPPQPAWPEPGRELNRLAFDYAYEVVAANGRLYFGSSADHKVYALDLNTGQERWSFFTEAPVRFAPALEGERMFVASDDGWLYCLSAADGRLRWRFYGGPCQERIIGNGQMISRWPLRTGVAVEDGIVYFSAGMWPTEGVYVYALRAEDGTVLWQNDTSGTEYQTQPHPGSFAMTGVAPQGYVLGHPGQIFVPTGRNVPAAYDRATGQLLYYRSAPNTWNDRWGGTWCLLAQGLLFNWRCHVGPDIDVLKGEYQPDGNDGLIAFDARTGSVKRDFPGKLCAVVNGHILYAWGRGKITAYDFPAWAEGATPAECTLWETPHDRAYALILAGSTLVVGGQETVTALGAEKGNVLWQVPVKGQARSLAVADGHLLVSTTEGQIYCFGPQAVANPPTLSRRVENPPAPPSEEGDGGGVIPSTAPGAQRARNILDETGKKAGFCLVLGAGDGQLLFHLAQQSDLKIYCVEPDPEKVAAVRQALDEAGLYGVRVTVHQGPLRPLVYPDYFADLILLGDDLPGDLDNLSAREIYRVLRPCGGTAYLPSAGFAGGSPALRRWLVQGQAPEAEITISEQAVKVVRGPLPGADNWTHQYANAGRTGASADQRARLPLRLLWFGEPGPEHLINRHWQGPAPLCVQGRLFVVGQYRLQAVDAYNGRPLWTRDFPRGGRFPARSKGSNVAADEASVYLATGRECLRLDAATGETVQTYALPPPPADLPPALAETAVWSYLAVTERFLLGSLGSDQEGRCVFVLNKGDGQLRWTYTAQGVVSNNALALDENRVYLIEQTPPAEIDQAQRRGRKIDLHWKLLALDAATGEVVWETEQDIAGRTELWLAQGVLVATGGHRMSGYDAVSGQRLYVREARMARFPVIVGDTIYGEPAAYDLRTGEPKPRANPFTDGLAPWNFRRSYGCGSISGSTHLLLFRSGTLGFYDLAGDSGVHNFGGIRAGCHVNAIAANGLVLMPPGDAACTCSYNYQTTVALWPAAEQRDWAVFYDQLPTSSVRQAALNLGAPGDRRDAAGVLWLGTPRPPTQTRRSGLADPFRFTCQEGFGPYRFNADRVEIIGTDRPWIYTSGLKGLQRAELDLDILDFGFPSWPTAQPPEVDGREADPCWDGYKTIPLLTEKAAVTLRHDRDHLYVAYHRPAATDPTGQRVAWKKATTGQDAAVWQDDSFELYFSSLKRTNRCLHLGVSASGARYDARWDYVTPDLPVCAVPRLDVRIDGQAEDWGEAGLKVQSLPGPWRNVPGKMRPPENFDPSFRLGWNEDGLLLLAQVRDNLVHEWENEDELWWGDSLQIFLAPARGTREHYLCLVTPGAEPGYQPRLRLYDHRTAGEELTAQVAGQKTPDGYQVELLLPWKNLNINPAVGQEFGLQLLANDDDLQGAGNRFQALWHPAGDPNQDPLAYQTLRLAAEPSPPLDFKRSEKPDGEGFFTAVPPLPFPVPLPPLGAQGEEAAYNAAWAGSVQADPGAFTAELAIPWQTLTDVGFDRNELLVDLTSRGPLSRPPQLGQGFERVLVIADEMAQPRTLRLRLHFAELDDVQPGQRVFDVKVQGRVVLEDFDVVQAAGGRNRAVVKEINPVVAARALTLELVPKAEKITPFTAPILSGIEILPAVR